MKKHRTLSKKAFAAGTICYPIKNEGKRAYTSFKGCKTILGSRQAFNLQEEINL